MARTEAQNTARRAEYKQAKDAGLSATQARTGRDQTGDPFKHKGDPLTNFSKWSSRYKGGFPWKARRWIERQNRNMGLSHTASFGYRYFYHRYVDEFPDLDAIGASEGVKT